MTFVLLLHLLSDYYSFHTDFTLLADFFLTHTHYRLPCVGLCERRTYLLYATYVKRY